MDMSAKWRIPQGYATDIWNMLVASHRELERRNSQLMAACEEMIADDVNNLIVTDYMRAAVAAAKGVE